MVRLILIVFFCFVGESLDREVLSFETPILYPSKAHHFNQVYAHIRSHEGNFVNHPRDRGGMTYGGIARKMNPDWEGWYIVDKVRNKQRHDSIPSVEYYVKDFYLTIWVREGFENITDYELALNLFDFRIHSSPKTVELFTNRVLVKMGCEPTKFGPDWVDDRFNQVDPVEFILRLKIQRILLFNQIVTRHPDQMVFLRGWYRRIENI